MAKRPRKSKVANTQSTIEEVVIGDYKFDQPVTVEEEPLEYVEIESNLDANGQPILINGREIKSVKYVRVDPNKLVIRVDKDGKTIGHPIFHGNLKYAFDNFDPNKLPDGFEPFKRIPYPAIDPTQIFEGTDYVKVDGVWQDFHKVRDMTPQELLDRNIKLPKGV